MKQDTIEPFAPVGESAFCSPGKPPGATPEQHIDHVHQFSAGPVAPTTRTGGRPWPALGAVSVGGTLIGVGVAVGLVLVGLPRLVIAGTTTGLVTADSRG